MSRAAGIPAAHPAAVWQCGASRFDLTARALVMGVLNLTPDSFSDGGRFLDPAAALAHGRTLIEEGADLVDVGAESTRPGSDPVTPGEQWERLAPVIAPLALLPGACVSVDTASAWVAERALAAGARVVNDVSGLRDPAMAGVAARAGAGLVLMHMRGEPRTMQAEPHYDDVEADVTDFLLERARAAEAAGIPRAAIALDPGIGFGKTPDQNLELLRRLDELGTLGRPVLVGVSRKSTLGRIVGDASATAGTLAGSLAAAVAAFERGASMIRAHDVRETVEALAVAHAVERGRITA